MQHDRIPCVQIVTNSANEAGASFYSILTRGNNKDIRNVSPRGDDRAEREYVGIHEAWLMIWVG